MGLRAAATRAQQAAQATAFRPYGHSILHTASSASIGAQRYVVEKRTNLHPPSTKCGRRKKRCTRIRWRMIKTLSPVRKVVVVVLTSHLRGIQQLSYGRFLGGIQRHEPPEFQCQKKGTPPALSSKAPGAREQNGPPRASRAALHRGCLRAAPTEQTPWESKPFV